MRTETWRPPWYARWWNGSSRWTTEVSGIPLAAGLGARLCLARQGQYKKEKQERKQAIHYRQFRGTTMSHKYEGGCAHHPSFSENDPIDNHTCHCSVCKRVTGQPTTHVVFFNHGDLNVAGAGSLKRMPFNDQNPNGPLELCVCEECGTPIML